MLHLYIPQRIVLIFIVAIILILSGCGAEEEAWMEAKEADTIESYEEFLEEYPEGEFAELAMEAIDWKNAQETHTSKSYRLFIIRHPQGEYTEEARIIKEDLSWDSYFRGRRLCLERTKEYLNNFPHGIYSDQAMLEKEMLELVSIIEIVASGQGVKESAGYNLEDSGINKIILLNSINELHRWSRKIPESWLALSVYETSLVVVITSTDWVKLEKAEYIFTGDVWRVQHEVDIEVRDAKTGEVIKIGKLKGSDPEEFPANLPAFKDKIRGDPVQYEALEEWLSNIVKP